MKVLFINTTCGTGSTGRICGELAEEFEKEGNECRIAYGRSCSEKFARFGVKIGGKANLLSDLVATRLFDAHGRACRAATKRFLRWAEKFDPDLLWLHNIHGYYLNYEMLFCWIKSRPKMEVKWTLHDCWAFTGHCGFFTMAGCDKWQTGCGKCPQKTDYPASFLLDGSRKNFICKQEAFTGVKKMTLITPSQWLADLVKESFLKEYPVTVRYNTIDTSIFKPTPSNFRKEYGLDNKKMILGVANVWHKRKGLDDFLELAGMLDETYAIVLVGLTDKQIKQFSTLAPGALRIASNRFRANGRPVPPKTEIIYSVKTENGMAIPPDTAVLYEAITAGKDVSPTGAELILLTRTDSPQALAGLYTTADFFVNPTHEDNYPTTNLEAQACGAFVITYDVGGSQETIR